MTTQEYKLINQLLQVQFQSNRPWSKMDQAVVMINQSFSLFCVSVTTKLYFVCYHFLPRFKFALCILNSALKITAYVSQTLSPRVEAISYATRIQTGSQKTFPLS